jgi:hypothetical protein
VYVYVCVCVCVPVCVVGVFLSEVAAAVDRWLGPQAQQRDRCFSYRTDPDYDFRRDMATLTAYMGVLAPWLRHCCKERKNRDRSSTYAVETGTQMDIHIHRCT